MTALPLAGPSSPLRGGAEVRRCINWMPAQVESGTGKGGLQTYLKQCPGLRMLGSIGARLCGLGAAKNRLFAAVDNRLLEVRSDWTTIDRGPLLADEVKMAANETQLGVVADTARSTVLDLNTNTLSSVLTNWLGSTSINVLDGYGVYTQPISNHFYLTTNQDFTVLDALQFASAESSAGDIIAAIVKHRELLLMKQTTAEVWSDVGGTDFPLGRDESAVIDVGCAAAGSLQKINGVAYWLGRDEEGTAVVFGMTGYTPQRVSSHALEELLSPLTDLSEAEAWTYHQEGLSFYVLNVPGLETTWVYEVSSGVWHERGDWNDGWSQWRAKFHAVCFGRHIVADTEGNLYELTPAVNKYGSDPMVRDWISPHNATANIATQRFTSFEVVCDVGSVVTTEPQLMLRCSDDGGGSWKAWRQLGLGLTGQRRKRVRTTMLGSARDRVWNLRVTDDVLCQPISVLVNE